MGVVQAVAVGEDAIALALRAGRRLRWGHQIVFPVGDRRDQLLEHHFIVFDQPFSQIFKQRGLIGIVKQREIRLHAQRRVFTLNDIQPQGMESGDHQPARLFTPQRLRHTLFHLACGLVGKGDGSDMTSLIAANADQVRNFIGDHAGFAGASTRQHQARASDKFDGLLLSGV